MPRNRRDVDSQQKRMALVAVARRLFLTTGYESTTMAQIAKAAGVAANTLYWYFEDKDALLIALLDELLFEAMTEFEGVRTKSLRSQLLWLLARFETLPGLISTVHARSGASDAVRTWHDRFHLLLEAIIKQQLGSVGVPTSEHAAAAKVAMFTVEGLLSHHADDRAEQEAVTRFLVSHFAARGRAVRPRAGAASDAPGASVRPKRARPG